MRYWLGSLALLLSGLIATPTLAVELAAGHYVLLCNIATHYEQGMHADFDVN